jgi:serine/threonine protein kinase
MATVYLAEDLRHHRRVAIKVLRPELAAVIGGERFLREIETTASLRHPHILPPYDSGEAAAFLFYVMPLVEGESLRDRLTREKQLPIDDALQIARQVADALSYGHGRHIVHRDIKPENILLESGHAVVADFGIAKAVSAAGGQRLTETGLVVGTAPYMSPEQAAGAKDLDGRSDLHALARVLYEMLGGQPPFTGPTAESILRQHMVAAPPSITQLRPAVPARVAGMLVRALSFLGSVLVFAGHSDQAIAQLRTLIDRDPTFWYGYDFLGRAYQQAGRMDEAIASFQRAVDLAKDNAENWASWPSTCAMTRAGITSAPTRALSSSYGASDCRPRLRHSTTCPEARR